MGAVGRVSRGLRSHMFGALALVSLVMGITGGLATGLASAGLRSQTAIERLLEQTKLPDVMVNDPTVTEAETDAIRSLDGVHGAALLVGLAIFNPDAGYVNIGVSTDGRYGVDLDIPNVIRGRLSKPTSATEVVLDESIATFMNVDVGDVVHFESYSPEQAATWGDEPSDEQLAHFDGPEIELDVVGVSRHPADLTTDDPMSYFVALPPGFYEAHKDDVAEFFRFVMVDLGLAPSAATEGAVVDEIRTIVGPDALAEESGEQAGGPVAATLDFVGRALLAIAATVAMAGLVIGALLVFRAVTRASVDSLPLVAIGMTTRQRITAITLALAPAALVAGGVALVVAAATTSVLPFGLARRAEPDAGFQLQPWTLVGGTVATIVAVLAVVGLVASRVVRQRSSGRVRQSTAVASAARTGIPVAPLVGIDLAMGSGREGVPSGNHFATATMSLASAAGVAALVLGASIARLESTPAAYGWTWDYVVPAETATMLADDPQVEALAVVDAGTISIDGRPVVVRGIDTIKGAPPLLILHGRTPEAGEIVLGRRTMSDLGVGIGDSVTAVGTKSSQQLRVVGEAVFAGIVDVPEASWGGAVDNGQMTTLDYEEGGSGSGAVVQLADGVDRELFAQRFEDTTGHPPTLHEEPIELARVREIESLPWILSGFLAAAGLLALLNAVVTTVRRRGRDLAVLRSVGFAPNGVRRAVVTESVALATLGLAIGVPAGIIIGRILWGRLAASLGVEVLIDVPWQPIVAACAAALFTAAAFSLVPARSAARRPIAEALRAE